MPDEQRYLPLREAARRLGVSWSTLRYHVTRGRHQGMGRYAGRWEVDAAILASYARRQAAPSLAAQQATSPCARATLAALPGTSFDIAERIGYEVSTVRHALYALRKVGAAVRDPGHIWRQA
jgi:DNA-binding transcriptional ArsR family regulator